MKKIFLGLAVGLFAVAAANAYAAEDKGPKTVVIKDCQAKKAPVAFNHEAHTKMEGVSCKSCHHTGKNVGCADCHKTEQKGAPGVCTDMSLTKNPYHASCVGCHKEKKAGPVKCADCHKEAK